MLLLGACAAPPEAPPEAPLAATAPSAIGATPQPSAAPAPDRAALAAEEARALLAQAETDVQRARSKRALWQKAWEDLVVARQALAAGEHPRASAHARRSSELARLGLEQLAYPAVAAGER